MDEISKEESSSEQIRKWPMISRISQESIKKFKAKSKETRKHWGGFCKSTSIHGMQYLAKPGYRPSFLVRLWWITVIMVGMATAYHYSMRQYIKWSQTTIDADNVDDEISLRELPFPAFTICDNRKLNIAINEAELSEERNLIYLICGDDRIKEFNYTQEHLFNLIPPPTVNCTLQLITSGHKELWTSRCDRLMTRILTDQGVCYTFNMLNPGEIYRPGVKHGHDYHGRSTDWVMDKGYSRDSSNFDKNGSDALLTGPYPKRGNNKVLLRIYHQNNSNPQYCYGGKDGFRITLHNPDEFPMVGHRQHPWVPVLRTSTDKYLRIPAFKKTLVDFKSRKIVPSDAMSLYGPKQRKCYFPGEKHLAYFQKYSYNNCQQECLTNLTKNTCGCIDYYMPRLRMPGELENITTVCTEQFALMCALHFYGLWDQNRDTCECLPSCTTTDYDIIAYYSHRDSDLPKAEGEYEGLLVTEVIVSSSALHFVKSERRAVYTLVDFIADCGGVFGLFCGMSLISIVEFLYYGVLWLIGRDCKCFKRKKTTDPSAETNETHEIK